MTMTTRKSSNAGAAGLLLLGGAVLLTLLLGRAVPAAAPGAALWAARYNGPDNSNEVAYGIAVDSAGNISVTGYSWGGDPSAGGTQRDYATVKYDGSTGAPLWSTGDPGGAVRYNGPGNGNDRGA